MRVPTGEIYKWILIQLLTLLHIRYFPVDLGIHYPSFYWRLTIGSLPVNCQALDLPVL